MAHLPRALRSGIVLVLGSALSGLFILAGFYPSALASLNGVHPQSTPTVNPVLGLDIRVDVPARSGRRGAAVDYTFAVTNLRCPTDEITITARSTYLIPAFPGSLMVKRGTTAQFVGQVIVPTYLNDTDQVTNSTSVTALCAGASSISDAEYILTTLDDSLTPTPVGGPRPTPTLDAAFGVDLRVDHDLRYVDPGQVVTATLMLVNRTCSTQAFTTSFQGDELDASGPGTVFVAPQTTGSFAVQLHVYPGAQPGALLAGVFGVACEKTPTIADTQSFFVAVTIAGQTPTPSPRPTPTFSATLNRYLPYIQDNRPTPTPTATPVCDIGYPGPICLPTPDPLSTPTPTPTFVR